MPRRTGAPVLVAAAVALVALAVGLVLAVQPGYEMQGYALGIVGVAAVAAGLLMAYGASGRTYFAVLAAGLGAHAVGSLARYEVLYRVYAGSGDAGVYFGRAVELARSLYRLDLGVLGYSAQELAVGGQALWGTPFMQRVAAVVVALTGPTMRGAFLAFSILSFVGLVAFGAAYRRALGTDADRYLLWLMLWPSLAFWPSSIGKESVLMLGLGVAVLGFVLWPRVSGWVALMCGLGLVGLVRPHVLAVVVVSMGFAVLVTRTRSGRLGSRPVQVVLWAGVVTLTWFIALDAFGLASSDEVADFVQRQAQMTNIGGSATGILGSSPLYLPLAVISAVFRPFLWESPSVTGLLSAVEATILLVLVIRRRRGLWVVLKGWRDDRLVAFSAVFVVLYGVMLGYAMSNLGILARQRTLLLPSLLLLVFLARDGGRRYLGR